MTALMDTIAPGLFQGCRVLVLGGTSGIGLGAAQAFRHLGAQVLATGATEVETRTAAEANASAGIDFTSLDVRDGSAIKDRLAGLVRLDVLVNIAGAIRRDAEHDPEAFAETIAINLTSTMRACTAARAKLASARGCVVKIVSMLTLFGGAHVPGYAASKGGAGN